MKIAVVVVGLSVAVMTVLIYEALRQEFRLRGLKTRTVENNAAVRRKEEEIVDAKKKIQELKSELDTHNVKMDDLRKKKADIEKSTQEFEESLRNCNTEKEEAEKKKKDVSETITKLKADQEEGKKKAEEDIKSLKQQILDRDKAICAFADTTKEEARKLCGVNEAPK